MTQYHVRIRGRVLGPFPLDTLRQLVRRGQVGRVHEVSVDGTSWSPAPAFPEIFDMAAPPGAQPSVPEPSPVTAGSLPPVVEPPPQPPADMPEIEPTASVGRGRPAWAHPAAVVGISGIVLALVGLGLMAVAPTFTPTPEPWPAPSPAPTPTPVPASSSSSAAARAPAPVPAPVPAPALVSAPATPSPPTINAAAILDEVRKATSEHGWRMPAGNTDALKTVVLAAWSPPAAREALNEVELALPLLQGIPAAYQLKLTKAEPDGTDGPGSGVTWKCGTAGDEASVGRFLLSGTSLSFTSADKPAPARALLSLLPVRVSRSGTAQGRVIIEPMTAPIGSGLIDGGTTSIPLVADAFPVDVCKELSKRLRLADATVGLALADGVPIEAAAASGNPPWSDAAAFAAANGGRMAIVWRPKHVMGGSGVPQSDRLGEPLTLEFGIESKADDAERGTMLAFRPQTHVTHPLMALVAERPDTRLSAFLKTATETLRPNLEYDEFVGILARKVFGCKKPDETPFGDLRSWLKDRRTDRKSLDGLADEVKAYIQERDTYRKHVQAVVEQNLAKAHPAGRPPAPGPEPASAKPNDAADKARYEKQVKDWTARKAALVKYDADRSRFETAVPEDMADFRRWVEGLVAADGTDADDRQLAELWRMLHLYGVLRRGGLPAPTKEDAPVYLHVNRFEGRAQLRWDFAGDPRNKPVFTTLADIAVANADAARPGRPRMVSASTEAEPSGD